MCFISVSVMKNCNGVWVAFYFHYYYLNTDVNPYHTSLFVALLFLSFPISITVLRSKIE